LLDENAMKPTGSLIVSRHAEQLGWKRTSLCRSR
jgi:hypothetical protein